MAKTLADIVYRRLMIGLSADQGRPMYVQVAALAASELSWSEQHRERELESLNRYSDSFSRIS